MGLMGVSVLVGLVLILGLLSRVNMCLVVVRVFRSTPIARFSRASGLDVRAMHRKNVRNMLIESRLVTSTRLVSIVTAIRYSCTMK